MGRCRLGELYKHKTNEQYKLVILTEKGRQMLDIETMTISNMEIELYERFIDSGDLIYKGKLSNIISKKFDNETICSYGKPIFYATIFPELKHAAREHGWALGLHGSLNNDMDIMAMPWTKEASPIEEMIKSISGLFCESPFRDMHEIPFKGKPNGRVVYTMPIFGDFYLDINVIGG